MRPKSWDCVTSMKFQSSVWTWILKFFQVFSFNINKFTYFYSSLYKFEIFIFLSVFIIPCWVSVYMFTKKVKNWKSFCCCCNIIFGKRCFSYYRFFVFIFYTLYMIHLKFLQYCFYCVSCETRQPVQLLSATGDFMKKVL